jgi:hypothetical protein
MHLFSLEISALSALSCCVSVLKEYQWFALSLSPLANQQYLQAVQEQLRQAEGHKLLTELLCTAQGNHQHDLAHRLLMV